MWNNTSEHFKKNHAETVDVTSLSMGFLAEDLGCNPVQLFTQRLTVMCRRDATAIASFYCAVCLLDITNCICMGT